MRQQASELQSQEDYIQLIFNAEFYENIKVNKQWYID